MSTVSMAKELSGELVRKMQRYRILIFIGISAAYLVSYFHRAAPAVVGPEIIKELGLSPGALGFMGSMYFLVILFIACALRFDSFIKLRYVGVQLDIL